MLFYLRRVTRRDTLRTLRVAFLPKRTDFLKKEEIPRLTFLMVFLTGIRLSLRVVIYLIE